MKCGAEVTLGGHLFAFLEHLVKGAQGHRDQGLVNESHLVVERCGVGKGLQLHLREGVNVDEGLSEWGKVIDTQLFL